jgi:hypothetical protein
MWTFESNSAITYGTFANDLGKTPSKGSWYTDYLECCQKQRLVPCPFFKVEELASGVHSCKVMNGIIDIGTWRSFLVASSTLAGTIAEICLSNVSLSCQHLDDLATLLKTNESIISVKLDYLDISAESVAFAHSVKNILSLSSGVQYISMRGNGLTDEFLGIILPALKMNCTIQGINFANNQIGPNGFASLIHALPFALSLNSISLRYNQIDDSCLASALSVLIGGLAMTSEAEAEIKVLVKAVNDRNKHVKDQNKKRKKEGLPELAETDPPTSRVINIKGSPPLLLNKQINLIDLSWNPGYSDDGLLQFAETIMPLCAAQGAGREIPLQLCLKGASDRAKAILQGCNFTGIVALEL